MFSSIDVFLTKWNRVLIALLVANFVALCLLSIQRQTLSKREIGHLERLQAVADRKTEQNFRQAMITAKKTERNFEYILLELARIHGRMDNIEIAAKSSSGTASVGDIRAQTRSRIKLTEPLTLTVDATAEVGRSAVYTTPQAAINDLRDNYDIAGKPVTISIKGGHYGPIVIAGQFVGANAQRPVSLEGASPQSVIIDGSTGSAFVASRGTQVAIRGVSFRSAKASCLEAADSATIIYITQVNFGECPVFQLNATVNAEIRISGDYTISGDAQNHYSTSYGGLIEMESIGKVTAIGKRTFSEEFALARFAGMIIHNGTTFVGEF